MKKRFTAVMPVFIMLTIACICALIYMIFTNQLPKMPDKNPITNVHSGDSVVLARNELPRLDAGINLQPLMTSVVRDFTQDASVSDGIFNYSDTNGAYRKLLNGEVDIIFATYPSNDIITMAKAKGIELEVVPIAREGFAFLVNSDNPVSSLNISDVQKIYSGQITNWGQVGGEDNEIKAFQKTNTSLTQDAMLSLVMNNFEIIEPLKTTIYDKSFGEISDVVANYDNSENAIGYSFYSDAKVIYDVDTNTDSSVKFLEINDVAPNYDTIHDGTYPIQMNYYLIKNKENVYENVQLFVNAMVSDRGKNAVKEAGYIDN